MPACVRLCLVSVCLSDYVSVVRACVRLASSLSHRAGLLSRAPAVLIEAYSKPQSNRSPAAHPSVCLSVTHEGHYVACYHLRLREYYTQFSLVSLAWRPRLSRTPSQTMLLMHMCTHAGFQAPNTSCVSRREAASGHATKVLAPRDKVAKLFRGLALSLDAMHGAGGPWTRDCGAGAEAAPAPG